MVSQKRAARFTFKCLDLGDLAQVESELSRKSGRNQLCAESPRQPKPTRRSRCEGGASSLFWCYIHLMTPKSKPPTAPISAPVERI